MLLSTIEALRLPPATGLNMLRHIELYNVNLMLSLLNRWFDKSIPPVSTDSADERNKIRAQLAGQQTHKYHAGSHSTHKYHTDTIQMPIPYNRSSDNTHLPVDIVHALYIAADTVHIRSRNPLRTFLVGNFTADNTYAFGLDN